MKKTNLFAVAVFMMAIGTAVASDYLLAVPGYTRKADVPGQVADCEQRGSCEGNMIACEVTFDHDNDPLTAPITRQLWDASSGTCGVQLKRNN